MQRGTIHTVPVGSRTLRIHEWNLSNGHQQWGVLLQTAGTSLTETEMLAVLRAFCGRSRKMFVLSTRYAAPSYDAALQVKRLVESGNIGAPLNVRERSPCFNPNADNINGEAVTGQTVDDRRE